MSTGLKVARIAAVVALAFAVRAQSPIASGAQAPLSPGAPLLALPGDQAQGELFREIDDPHTGMRWLLMHNDANPGGPGRFTLISAGRSATGGGPMQPLNPTREARLHPVIRAGDRLIVEEHTAVADAVLEARALSSAAPGAALTVRLAIGGRVLRVVALGPGRAAFQPETAVRP